jgi:hypothetical protein
MGLLSARGIIMAALMPQGKQQYFTAAATVAASPALNDNEVRFLCEKFDL